MKGEWQVQGPQRVGGGTGEVIEISRSDVLHLQHGRPLGNIIHKLKYNMNVLDLVFVCLSDHNRVAVMSSEKDGTALRDKGTRVTPRPRTQGL